MREMIDSPLTGDFECKTRYIILTITEGSEYMRNMIKRFSVAVLLAVMTVMFTSPALASVTNSFYQAEPSKTFVDLLGLHMDDVEDSLLTSNHLDFDDTESFLFTSFDRDFDSYIEIEGIQLSPRITNVVTFEMKTSIKAYNEVTEFELLNNEVGWANYRF
jgi:hypothetical protein